MNTSYVYFRRVVVYERQEVIHNLSGLFVSPHKIDTAEKWEQVVKATVKQAVSSFNCDSKCVAIEQFNFLHETQSAAEYP